MSGLNWQHRWDPVREIHREMSRLFKSLEPLQNWRIARHFPAINIYDDGDRFILTVPVPGMAPEEIDLSITGETLTLRGERKRPEQIHEESYRRQECTTGRWTRSITLPDRVESSQITASCALGILTVSVPKAESARPRQITVSAAG